MWSETFACGTHVCCSHDGVGVLTCSKRWSHGACGGVVLPFRTDATFGCCLKQAGVRVAPTRLLAFLQSDLCPGLHHQRRGHCVRAADSAHAVANGRRQDELGSREQIVAVVVCHHAGHGHPTPSVFGRAAVVWNVRLCQPPGQHRHEAQKRLVPSSLPLQSSHRRGVDPLGAASPPWCDRVASAPPAATSHAVAQAPAEATLAAAHRVTVRDAACQSGVRGGRCYVTCSPVPLRWSSCRAPLWLVVWLTPPPGRDDQARELQRHFWPSQVAANGRVCDERRCHGAVAAVVVASVAVDEHGDRQGGGGSVYRGRQLGPIVSLMGVWKGGTPRTQ